MIFGSLNITAKRSFILLAGSNILERYFVIETIIEVLNVYII